MTQNPEHERGAGNADFRRLLLAMKDYLEAAEVARQRSADPAWTLDQAIGQRALPEVYYEILDELSGMAPPPSAAPPLQRSAATH